MWTLYVEGKYFYVGEFQKGKEHGKGIKYFIEEALVSIWSKLLKLDESQISITANFFELGGHSLLAVRLVAEIRAQLGHELTIRTVFDTPTIRGLVLAIDISAKRNDSHEIIELNKSQSKNVIFVFHPLGGEVICYKKLALQINESCKVYGVRAPFTGKKEFRFDSLIDLANYYVEKIKKVQPSGPYNLMGYSAGGQIAYYVAKSLAEKGCKISLLYIIDSAIPKEQEKTTIKKILERTLEFILKEALQDKLIKESKKLFKSKEQDTKAEYLIEIVAKFLQKPLCD